MLDSRVKNQDLSAVLLCAGNIARESQKAPGRISAVYRRAPMRLVKVNDLRLVRPVVRDGLHERPLSNQVRGSTEAPPKE
jgi:hypothetical protein